MLWLLEVVADLVCAMVVGLAGAACRRPLGGSDRRAARDEAAGRPALVAEWAVPSGA